MKTSEAKAVLAELDRAEACLDAVGDIRAALDEARSRPPGWFEQWLPDHEAEVVGMFRVIDESGESYLYSKKLFIRIEFPHDVAEILR